MRKMRYRSSPRWLYESNKLYIMLMSEDGVFAGSGDINDLWSFAMKQIRRVGLMNSSIYAMYIKYNNGNKFSANTQAKIFRFLREYNDPDVLNAFKMDLKKNKPMYIELVTDNISFRIGTPDTFCIVNVEDRIDDGITHDVSDVAPRSGIRQISDDWFDQIL